MNYEKDLQADYQENLTNRELLDCKVIYQN